MTSTKYAWARRAESLTLHAWVDVISLHNGTLCLCAQLRFSETHGEATGGRKCRNCLTKIRCARFADRHLLPGERIDWGAKP